MLYGRVLGLVLFFGGILLSVILYFVVQTQVTRLPKVMFIGPAMAGVGIGLLIRPGAAVSWVEAKNGAIDRAKFFSDAPMIDKVIWGVCGVVGLLVGATMLGW